MYVARCSPWINVFLCREELTFEMLALEHRASDDETLESEASIGTADSSENLNVDSEGATSDFSGVWSQNSLDLFSGSRNASKTKAESQFLRVTFSMNTTVLFSQQRGAQRWQPHGLGNQTGRDTATSGTSRTPWTLQILVSPCPPSPPHPTFSRPPLPPLPLLAASTSAQCLPRWS